MPQREPGAPERRGHRQRGRQGAPTRSEESSPAPATRVHAPLRRLPHPACAVWRPRRRTSIAMSADRPSSFMAPPSVRSTCGVMLGLYRHWRGPAGRGRCGARGPRSRAPPAKLEVSSGSFPSHHPRRRRAVTRRPKFRKPARAPSFSGRVGAGLALNSSSFVEWIWGRRS